jgi:hypothetical protein
MHDWTDLIPTARTICAGVVAVTRTTIILRDLRRRRAESSAQDVPGRTELAPPDRQPNDRPTRTSRVLELVSVAAQVGGAATTIVSWLHEGGVL